MQMTDLEFCHILFCALVPWLCLVTLLNKHQRREGAAGKCTVEWPPHWHWGETLCPSLSYLLEVFQFSLHSEVVAFLPPSPQDWEFRWACKYKNTQQYTGCGYCSRKLNPLVIVLYLGLPVKWLLTKIKCYSTETLRATIPGQQEWRQWEVTRKWWNTKENHPSSPSL